VFKIEETCNKRRIYTLNGLPPEVVAVAFAKCSRSPEPFDQIAEEESAAYAELSEVVT